MAELLMVAVIGAGVAGLTTARELLREGHRVVVYEKSGQIGGTWVYDPRVESDPLGRDPNREIIHSSLYASLTSNFPRQLMGFSDYPFKIGKNGEVKTFPGHEEVLEFLNSFAGDFGLVELIRLNSEVVRVERVDGQWTVESKTERNEFLKEWFDAVVVCNGHHTKPRIADISGIEKWPGKQTHSHSYRVPKPFMDQVVIVIGYRASGHDISAEIAKVAKEVHLSCRSPSIDRSNLDYHRDKNIWLHSEIVSVHGNGEVVFEDGASVRADIILHCTGYNYDFPFLETNGIITVDDRRVGPLYKHVFPPKLAPHLSFVGIPYGSIGFHTAEFQAKWVSRVLSGKVLLPSEKEMSIDIEKFYQQREELGVPKHHTHSLRSDKFEYLDWLAAQVGEPSVDDELKEIYTTLLKLLVDKGPRRLREFYEKNCVS